MGRTLSGVSVIAAFVAVIVWCDAVMACNTWIFVLVALVRVDAW